MNEEPDIIQVLRSLATWYEYRRDDPSYRKTADALKETADRITALEAELEAVKREEAESDG